MAREGGGVHLEALGAATHILGVCLRVAGGGAGAVLIPRRVMALATRAAAALLHMHALRWPGALAARALQALEVLEEASLRRRL